MFFAFIGFDAISTTAEECRRPNRDLPIGILGSLGLCTVIYVVVAAVLTGMVPWNQLNTAEPLSVAMRVAKLDWAAGIVAFGSVVAHTAVLLVFQLGQPRILMSMSRDGLLPPLFSRVHPRFRTPFFATLVTGIFVAVGSALASLEEMADLCNIGTLSAFLLVCVGILVLRRRDPHRVRPFRTPWVPVVPVAGRRRVLLAVGRFALAGLGPLRRVAGCGDRVLHPVRPPPQPVGTGQALGHSAVNSQGSSHVQKRERSSADVGRSVRRACRARRAAQNQDRHRLMLPRPGNDYRKCEFPHPDLALLRPGRGRGVDSRTPLDGLQQLVPRGLRPRFVKAGCATNHDPDPDPVSVQLDGNLARSQTDRIIQQPVEFARHVQTDSARYFSNLVGRRSDGAARWRRQFCSPLPDPIEIHGGVHRRRHFVRSRCHSKHHNAR